MTIMHCAANLTITWDQSELDRIRKYLATIMRSAADLIELGMISSERRGIVNIGSAKFAWNIETEDKDQ